MASLLGPGSVPQELRVPWGFWTAIIVFALVWIGLPAGIFIATGELAHFFQPLAWFYHGLLGNDVYAIFIEDIIDAAAGFALIAYILRRHHLTFANVGWRRFSLKQALLVFIGIFFAFTIGVGLLLTLVTYLVPGFNENQAQTNDFSGGVALAHPVMAIIALVIVPPIIEETTFRGLIFPALSKRFGVFFGAITSSILFGFAHLQANVSVYTWLLGMLLCWMYVRTKSILPGMALHMLNNLLATLVILGGK